MTIHDIKPRLLGYLDQSEIIHKRGNQLFYNTMKRLNAIDRLQVLRNQAEVSRPHRFAAFILKHEEDLHTVLPHPSNHAYHTTRRNLDELISFCRAVDMQNQQGTIQPAPVQTKIKF